MPDRPSASALTVEMPKGTDTFRITENVLATASALSDVFGTALM
jgi:hypothetical protein